MSKIRLFFISLVILSNLAFGKNYLDENLKKMNWNGIDVIWLEDDNLPTYDVYLYFDEGALGDPVGLNGLTELMFDQLTSGTGRYSQKDLLESLEFFGAEYGSRVTHEYSTFQIGGMVKDIVPTMKMVCHIFEDASFPENEIKRSKKRIIAGMKSIVANHSSLASRAFRYEALKGSGFESPATGLVKTLTKLGQKNLKKRLDFFNTVANKRIYIKGPKDVMQLENVFKHDCKWTQGSNNRKIPEVANWRDPKELIFIPVANANQAQVRVGRILTTSEVQGGEQELKSFASNFLGSGFTSRLFKKLRIEKGLTYSVSSYVSDQHNYGRSGINTFTKNESIVDLLNSIKEVLDTAEKDIDSVSFDLAKKSIKGQYLIGLESTSEFLQNLLHFDHIQRNYSDIYKFTENIDKIEINDLKRMISQIFGWNRQTILILGNKSLIPVLKKAGYKVRTEKYSQYI